MSRYRVDYAYLKNMPDVLYADWELADLDMRRHCGRGVMRTTDRNYVDVTGFVYGKLVEVDDMVPTIPNETRVVIHEYVPKYTKDALGYPVKDAPNISRYNGMTGTVKSTYWLQGEEIACVELWICHNIAVSKLEVLQVS